MEDNQILGFFNTRNERAIEETQLKYGKLCRKIAAGVLGNAQDAQECENDTYLALWDSIPPAEPQSFVGYVCKTARNLALKKYSYNTAKKRNSHYDACLDELEDCLSAGTTPEQEIEAKETARVIEEFLNGLSAENRFIFMSRYWFSDSYADIAEGSGISEKNVSVRLTRIRADLRKFLEEKEIM